VSRSQRGGSPMAVISVSRPEPLLFDGKINSILKKQGETVWTRLSRKLRNEEFHIQYSSPSIIRISKSKR
jgi:hypothetical protein